MNMNRSPSVTDSSKDAGNSIKFQWQIQKVDCLILEIYTQVFRPKGFKLFDAV